MNKKHSIGHEDTEYSENNLGEYPLCEIVREAFNNYPIGFPVVTGFPYKNTKNPFKDSENGN